MKKLILMTILFLTLQSSGYINFKGAHFRKLEEGEHYYYILRISLRIKISDHIIWQPFLTSFF